MFRVILAVDIQRGEVVKAVRGDRQSYRPLEVCGTTGPVEVVRRLRPLEVYIADLDRIEGRGDNLQAVSRISEETETLLDPGVRSLQDLEECLPFASTLVLGSETTSLRLIEKAAHRHPWSLAVSLDMKNGSILTQDVRLKQPAPRVLETLNHIPLRELIVLNLDLVGTRLGLEGLDLEVLASTSRHPLIFGGGIRDNRDLKTLREAGFQGAITATAIHQGKIELPRKGDWK